MQNALVLAFLLNLKQVSWLFDLLKPMSMLSNAANQEIKQLYSVHNFTKNQTKNKLEIMFLGSENQTCFKNYVPKGLGLQGLGHLA